MLEFDQEYLRRGGVGAISIEALDHPSLLRNPPVRFGDMPFRLRQVLQNDFAIHDGSAALPVPANLWRRRPYLTTNSERR